MKPFGNGAVSAQEQAGLGALEAAPARNRVRMLAIGIFLVLLLLAGRAVQLAFSGDPLATPRHVATGAAPRADIVDRNGVLLATTVRAYALTATPSRVWDAPAIADTLRNVFPELDRATTIRRLTDASRQLVYLRRGLTPAQRDRIHELGLAGIGFETEHHRDYPQGALAAHALGFTDVDLNPLSGAERGLDAEIRAAGAEGRPVRLSIDVRMQYALEEELATAAQAAHASSGAAILLDGRTGETLALASWPTFNPNEAGQASETARRDRVAGDVHELGSTIKPFTVAMALQEQLTTSAELFDLSQPFDVDGSRIEDHDPIRGYVTLREILAHSSNIGAARLALRLGGARQRSYLDRLGLTAPTSLELGRNQAPLAPAARGRRDVAGLGFGYGLAATPATLAGAYTIFTNNGARVQPTLLARGPDATIERTSVFSPEVTRQVMTYMRSVVTDGTGRAADVPGLLVAGKTGTAEKLGNGAGYDESRNFSSFAGVFPANDPRYVIVLALDDTGEGAAGGMVAAPAVSRTLRRIAPMLGLRVEPRAPAREGEGMKLGDLFDYGVPAGAGAIDITGLTADSRKVKPGFLFAALKGVAAHGRDFVEQAKANGAVAVLSAGDLGFDPGIAEVVTEEPRKDFALAASAFFVRRPATIVAVTGTNGKSSTVDFLRQIWTHAGRRAASMGTLGAIGPSGVIDLGHTTPDPAAVHATLSTLSEDGVTHVAMEASSHGLEQHRVDGVTFAAAAFTNLTQDHLDYHVDMARYRDAKLRLWELVRVGGPAVINADAADADPFERAAKHNDLDVVLCGWRAPREKALKIVEILPRPNAQTMVLLWNGKEHKVELPLIGEFQALNATCAAALALSLGDAPEAVFAGMAQLKPVKGRMEHVGQSKSGGHVFVDYAHTPDGLDVLLRAARPHAPGRIIAVFGCGGDRDTDKRPKMGAIAARQADVVIVTDDNPRSEEPSAIRAQILAAAPGAIEIGDRGQAIREAISMLKPGDALMIAGKGHETGQIIKGVTHPFSDQDVARAALEN